MATPEARHFGTPQQLLPDYLFISQRKLHFQPPHRQRYCHDGMTVQMSISHILSVISDSQFPSHLPAKKRLHLSDAAAFVLCLFSAHGAGRCIPWSRDDDDDFRPVREREPLTRRLVTSPAEENITAFDTTDARQAQDIRRFFISMRLLQPRFPIAAAPPCVVARALLSLRQLRSAMR